MTSALGIFGPGTLVDRVRALSTNVTSSTPPNILTEACMQLQVPFQGYDWVTVPLRHYCHDSEPHYAMPSVLTEWLRYIAPSRFYPGADSGEQRLYDALGSTLFYASTATLSKPLTGDFGAEDLHHIFTSDGQEILKLRISKSSMAGISVLLALHLVGLTLLTSYACYFPIWTRTLDAFAVLRIGNCADAKISGPAVVNPQRVKNLDRLDSLGRPL